MQIYEIFGKGLLARGKAMLNDPKSLTDPTKYAQAKQAGYSASALKSAEKLSKQGYGQLKQATSPSQLVAKVQTDSAAQQLINTWASQWPKLAPTPQIAPAATKPTAAPTTPAVPTQPMSMGGQPLNPNDPVDAKILAQLKAQGKLNEATTYADQYRAAFTTWANNVIARTIKQPNVFDSVNKDPNWKPQLDKALKNVVDTAMINTSDSPQRNAEAVKNYLTVAIAAVRGAQEEQEIGTPTAPTRTGGTGIYDPKAEALAKSIGVNGQDLAKLNAYIKRSGEKINPRGTGSQSLDALLKAAKLI